MNVASVSLVSSNGGLVIFPKFLASNSFDIDQILEVVLRDGSDLAVKESLEVCLNDVLSQVGSFEEESVRPSAPCQVPSRLPDNEDPEERKNFKLKSFIA